LIDSFLTNIKAYLYERVSNPLISTFMFSWFIWNYKLFIVIFSSDSLVQKFSFIQYNIYQTQGDLLLYNLFYPMITTYLYLYVLPRLTIKVYKKWKEDQQEIVKLKQDLEGEELLSVEKSKELKMELYKFRDEAYKKQQSLVEELETYKKTYSTEQQRYKDEINSNKQRNSSMEQEIKSLQEENNKLKANLELKKESKNIEHYKQMAASSPNLETIQKDLVASTNVKNLKKDLAQIKTAPMSNKFTDDEKILLFIKKRGEASIANISNELSHLDQDTIERKISKFVQEGILKFINNSSDKDDYYYLSPSGEVKVSYIK